ncbi:MAG: SO_0444 family Cu/Zn efflux transporter [Planctomycetota bacterium]
MTAAIVPNAEQQGSALEATLAAGVWEGAARIATDAASSLWSILVSTGPWLLGGFLIAGVLHVALPTDWVRKRFGGGGFGSIVGAALIGAPLPLCSCSIIPAAAQFRRSGASKGSSAAFAIATPEIDVPAASLTWAMLGWPIAVARVVGALVSAVVAGVSIDAPRHPGQPSEPVSSRSTETGPPAPCCHDHDSAAIKPPAPLAALRYAFWDLPRDLSGWMTVGLVLAALVAAFVPTDGLERVGSGWPAMLAMLVVGIPVYVCAASSTPLAAVLVAKGLDPGAAVVFLLAGPATNPATIAWVVKDLGARAAVPYLASIAVVSLAAGFAVSSLGLSPTIINHAGHDHASLLPEPVAAAGGLLLAVVLGAPLLSSGVRSLKRVFVPRPTEQGAADQASPSWCSHAPAATQARPAPAPTARVSLSVSAAGSPDRPGSA